MLASTRRSRDATASALRETTAEACRQAASCDECAALTGCGWSLVRRRCYRAHPIATTADALECAELPEAATKTVDAWLNQANALVLGRDGYGPRAMRDAFRALERASEAAKADAAKASEAGTPAAKAAAAAVARVRGALSELTPKLEAVFDDRDYRELLDASRHPSLGAIHPDMPIVERRTAAEAREYISRGEPVIITDLFEGADAKASPVSHKWTLEYLNRRVFGAAAATAAASKPAAAEAPRFNVATDSAGACCRYFEPRPSAHKANYPYPFSPSTHLYRDRFDGYVSTVRASHRSATSRKTLHYLHEIVMNPKGEAVVAGAPAPPALSADLSAIKRVLQPLGALQPFFGGFASAKLWLGQRGIVMPIHYDATDNLYVMGWGRKRAIIGPPGQLDTLYRYPNGHPLVGSSQVNLSSPDLSRYPRFAHAQLRELIVGVGDVLYLPGWWWHQFEQPFEDSASLNVWSKDREGAPDPSVRDLRVREHSLSDQLESAVVQVFGNEAGEVLSELATSSSSSSSSSSDERLARANSTLHSAADAWRRWAGGMPGGHAKAAQPSSELVVEYLELTHRHVIPDARARWPEWRPGVPWDLSGTAPLPRSLRERCEATRADAAGVFMSHCR